MVSSPQCITLSLLCSSSGLTTTGPAVFASNRQVELAHREHNINDIAISRGGAVLYCAAGSVVQIWDLRRLVACEISEWTVTPVFLGGCEDGSNVLLSAVSVVLLVVGRSDSATTRWSCWMCACYSTVSGCGYRYSQMRQLGGHQMVVLDVCVCACVCARTHAYVCMCVCVCVCVTLHYFLLLPLCDYIHVL